MLYGPVVDILRISVLGIHRIVSLLVEVGWPHVLILMLNTSVTTSQNSIYPYTEITILL